MGLVCVLVMLRCVPVVLLALLGAACGGPIETSALGPPGDAPESNDPPPSTDPASPSPAPSPAPARCELALETGPCDAAFQRFGFDPALGRCREFLWGGCDGNENNFETFDACRSTCGGDAEPQACGGWSGRICGADAYCDFPHEGCDFADGQGVCRPRPEGCFEIYAPVCGCDGLTYGNECEAQANGTDAARNGTCEGS